MTKQELKDHCLRTLARYCTGNAEKEHKLVLKILEENEAMKQGFDEINNLVYGNCITAGSKDYFTVREICCEFKPKKERG